MALAGLLNKYWLQPLPPSEQTRGYVARPKQRYYLIARNTGTDDFTDVGFVSLAGVGNEPNDKRLPTGR